MISRGKILTGIEIALVIAFVLLATAGVIAFLSDGSTGGALGSAATVVVVFVVVRVIRMNQ